MAAREINPHRITLRNRSPRLPKQAKQRQNHNALQKMAQISVIFLLVLRQRYKI